MAEDEMYLSNLDAWICEEKRIITYRWLSNQLSVSSNVAKQMLHAFVTKKGEEVQTVYLISGDRKGHGHTVMLVGQAKLADTKKEFSSIFSLHIYSVQAVLPKDTAQLWAVDNEQRKEIFAQDNNPIATNRWSAIEHPEAHKKRELYQPASPEPQPVVKKERTQVQVKTQPKEEADSSQPSSPEKEKPTATKAGRITTKKGSPIKKEAANTREMTSFFKRAPEDEKTQTLLANAKAGKAKGASPSKKKVMENFFSKKRKADDGEAEEAPSEPSAVKVKQEKQDDDADLDDMDFESKDTTKRTRLRKGKRKRGLDDDEDEAAQEDDKEKPKPKVREQPEDRPQEEKDSKRKRRRVIKQEPEAEDEEGDHGKVSTVPPKKADQKKRKNKDANDDDEEEEDNREKENEDNNVISNLHMPAKKAVIERKEGVAKPAEPMPGTRRKKRVRRERTYVDDKGFEVTEDVWEEVSDDDVPVPPALHLASIKEESANNGDVGAGAVKKKQTAQANIMSFFGKGKK